MFNTPGANANAVKELVMAGLLMSSRPIIPAIAWIESLGNTADLAQRVEQEKSRFVGTELKGKTLGVIGLGAIGILIANLAVELDMQVVGYDPYISVDAAWKLSRQVRHAESLEAVLKTADYVTIHVPLTPQTKNLIAASQLKLMKTGAVLLNFARGGLVQEDAVLAALAARQIRGYVTDFPSPALAGKEGCNFNSAFRRFDGGSGGKLRGDGGAGIDRLSGERKHPERCESARRCHGAQRSGPALLLPSECTEHAGAHLRHDLEAGDQY